MKLTDIGERNRLKRELAEAQAALLRMEADLAAQLAESKVALAAAKRLHTDASKNGQDLYTLAASLRAQLELSPCGHLKAEWVDVPGSGNYPYCLACKREADAVRRAITAAADICKEIYGLL